MTNENFEHELMAARIRNAVAGHFTISSIRFGQSFASSDQAVRLTGDFLTPTETAYDAIAARAREFKALIYFRREDDEPVIYAVPGTASQVKPRWNLAVGLFAATVLSVFFTGAVIMASPDFAGSFDWRSGLSYALPLITILLAHELGHFFVARHHRIAVSPPYFIPLPLIGFGTLGAVIAMLAPPKNRRHLLQMGAAGPLAGLVFAIPILLYGLSTSGLIPQPDEPYMMEGNSLAYAGFKYLIFGQWLPAADGLDVSINNIAFAGWMGLLITALNLIPAGQLDGGHALFTLFGQRLRIVTFTLIAALIGLALWTQFWGWLIWAGLLYFFGRVYAVPMDDLTPLDAKHKALAAFMLVLWVLLFVANPLQAVTP